MKSLFVCLSANSTIRRWAAKKGPSALIYITDYDAIVLPRMFSLSRAVMLAESNFLKLMISRIKQLLVFVRCILGAFGCTVLRPNMKNVTTQRLWGRLQKASLHSRWRFLPCLKRSVVILLILSTSFSSRKSLLPWYHSFTAATSVPSTHTHRLLITNNTTINHLTNKLKI